ncbi:MAG: hypothetical protein C4554_08105 [Dethiobacter sp.]|nr:MAG: hypothetical protein C4554_08105 [Dethiobacter sp.]
MRRLILHRKFFICLALVLFLFAGSVAGLYFYTLNRYSHQLAGLLDFLLAEELPGKTTPGENIAGDQKPSTHENRGDNSVAQEFAGTEKKETAPFSEVPAPIQRQPLLEEIPLDEFEELKTKVPLIRKVEIKDQLFTLQMVKKFSTGELKEMMRLFSEGGSSLKLLQKKLEEKINPEEMNKVREIARKYQGLL